MRNFFMLTLLFAVFAAPALAQEEPKAEVFGGYEYVRINPGGGLSGYNCHGGGGNVAYNLNNWLGGVGDFAGCKVTGLPSGVSLHTFSYLFGPRVSYRTYSRLTPFGQVLFGGVHLGGSTSDNAFALTVGGGADYKFTDHISFRGQAEYLHTHFGGTGQNNARILAGIVYRWGGR